MNELKTKLSIDTKEVRKDLNEIEEQIDRIIKKMNLIKKNKEGQLN